MVMPGIVHSSGAFLLQNPHSMSENSLYLRATFFYNQMRVKNDVISSRISDFGIGKYIQPFRKEVYDEMEKCSLEL